MNLWYVVLPFLIVGCAGNPTAERGVEIANKSLEEEHSPVRVAVKVFDNGVAVMTPEWAGIPGESIVNSAETGLYTDILKSLKDGCGFDSSDLREVRIVEHNHPAYYEVWVFNDKKSTRPDGTSAMSVLMRFLPDGGGTDLEFIGKCHS